MVDIYYDLADPDSASLAITVLVSTDGGASYTLPATSFSGSGWGSAVTPGSNKQITWNAGADWSGHYSAKVRFRVIADDAAVASDMALIPAGIFTMGNCMDPSEGNPNELPMHTVYVSAFYMDKYLVTKGLWDTVKVWKGGNGYSYDYAGSGKANTHPVQTVNWYDMVKWCNARSEKEGWVPCYYADSGLTAVYKTGQVAPYVKWGAKGYRLPTEAEWEKAARGGANRHRFPWSDADTINQSRANYYSEWSGGVPHYPYDVNPTSGYHPTFKNGVIPYTSPVGYFAPNGYGLYDMVGNVWEWCWDWQSDTYYTSSPGSDPVGPDIGLNRVLRGGGWSDAAYWSRCADRNVNYGGPSETSSAVGFRCVRRP